MKRAPLAAMEVASNLKPTIEDDSDLHWEAVGTTIPPESLPQTERLTVKFDEVEQADHRKLRNAKARRFTTATNTDQDVQTKQDLSLGLKAKQLCDGLVTSVLDMVLKAILLALLGYIVLPVQSFDSAPTTSKWTADGLIWGLDKIQPYVARLTAAVRQCIARSGKYIIDNKHIWNANGKRFGKMAADALLWTLSSAGRIVLAFILLHAVLLCLHSHQSRQSEGVQQQNPFALEVPDLTNLLVDLDRYSRLSDLMDLAWKDVQAGSEAGSSAAGDAHAVPYCPFGYPKGQEDETIPSNVDRKEHIMQLTPMEEWLKKNYEDIVKAKEEFGVHYEEIVQELRTREERASGMTRESRRVSESIRAEVA
ncbi:hypothetical protein AC578_3370 [Pseudocercospora eumusae]|uniref:Uncharacterized protein n=1 Tax=Pseudocercospora eumusae TaxID=321146 RepID=A0A139HDD8_9PEZI|nr:hypothetical protein AC578_3370 [Pseudocercospora eumusae]